MMTSAMKYVTRWSLIRVRRSPQASQRSFRACVLVIGIVLGFSPARSGSGEDSVVSGQAERMGRTSSTQSSGGEAKKYMYNYSSLRLRGGQTIDGLFAGVLSDSILIWQRRGIHRVGLDQAERLSVQSTGERAGLSGLHGLLIGGYCGLLIGKFAKSPQDLYAIKRGFSFIDPGSDGPWIVAGIGAFVGGAIGYLAASSSTSEATFDFSGDEAARRLEFERLKRSDRPSGPLEFHIGISAGTLTFNIGTTSGQQIRDYALWGAGERGRFNVFRRLTVTHSITSWAEVGLGFVNFSEPSLANQGTKGGTYVTMEQSSANTLYCIIGQVKPLVSILPREVSLDVGAGLGLATVDYRSSVSTHFFYMADTVYSFEKINKNSFGMTLFTGVTVFPDESFSIGCIVDYTAAPAIKVRSEPTLGLDSRTLGNVCIGIELGFHF